MSDDQLTVRHGISWEDFTAYVSDDDHLGRVHYLDGDLEIVSPGAHHEHVKYVLCLLIDRYLAVARIPAMGTASTTRAMRDARVGVEPDASYVFGAPPGSRDRCQLAIEVISTSGSIRKLEAYRRLGVEEVWFWVRGRIEIYSLRDAAYARAPRSSFMPGLDPDLLVRFVRTTTVDRSIDEILRQFSAEL